MRGCFVTGTDTGVGKTVVAAAIAAALSARGERVAAFKPVVTGLDDPRDPDWPPDHELLAAAAGTTPEAVAPLRFGPPVSPHLAAELEGVTDRAGRAPRRRAAPRPQRPTRWSSRASAACSSRSRWATRCATSPATSRCR